ncbi:MAG: hypothetical protein JSV01_10165, partial [Desulfobacterales bacterium]
SRFDVEKIIILTGYSTADDWLITRRSMLFPECEIEILSKRPESFKEDRLSLSNNTYRTQATPTQIKNGPRSNSH